MRNKRKFILGVLATLACVVGLWALHVELTFERNVRHGIPADFRLHRARVATWRT